MMTMLTFLLKDDSGATAIEYALIAALIAVVIIGSVAFLGSRLRNTYNNIANNIT